MRAAKFTAIAIVASLSVTLAGCNGSDSGSKKSTTTTTAKKSTATTTTLVKGSDRDAIVAFFTKDGNKLIVEGEADCMADKLQLSEAGIGVIRGKSGGQMSALSAADSDAVVAAMDSCVDFNRLTTAFGEELTTSSGLQLGAPEAQCAAKVMTANSPGPGEFVRGVVTMQQNELATSMLDALGGCMDNAAAATFVANLLSKQGQSPETSQCIAEKLVATMGVAPLLKAFVASSQGTVDPQLASVMTQSMVGCNAGPGASSAGSSTSDAPTTTAK